jgi:hypothetical protein
MQPLFDAMLGDKNKAYYLTKFALLEQKGSGLKPSWHWPAFFFGGLWALYRKMYGWFAILVSVTILANALERAGASTASALVFIISWFAFAIFANALYKHHLRKKIEEAKMTITDQDTLLTHLRSKGGVHTWVVWFFVFFAAAGMLTAMLLPLLVG